jgi:hypothetical protein
MTRAVAAVSLVALAGGAAGCGGEGLSAGQPPPPSTAPPSVQSVPPPSLTAEAEPARAKPKTGLPVGVPGVGTLTAYVSKPKVLRSRPGGKNIAYMKRLTEWKSPRVVTVVRRRGDWLAVLAPELRNGRVGWMDGRKDVRLFRTGWSIVADISQRVAVIRHDGRVFLRTRLAVGSPSAPTPRGRFAVTDKLTTGSDFGPYGCCILALTGHQPSIPQGWGGGDRIAMHGTPTPQTIGQAASHGCLRVTNDVARKLVRYVPLGTRVTIHD